jgi:serine protease DegQ
LYKTSTFYLVKFSSQDQSGAIKGLNIKGCQSMRANCRIKLASFCVSLSVLVPGFSFAQTAGIPTDTTRGVLSFAPLIRQAGPTVVRVVKFAGPPVSNPAKGVANPSSTPESGRPDGSGSGAVINAREGLIVTNAHVVDGGGRVEVQFSDGRVLQATLVGKDDATDIALLRVAPAGLSQIEISNSDDILVGDLVFAIGHPMGLDQSLTMGIVSGLGRTGIGDGLEDYIQTDAPINPGNSGGPLVDSRGRLIGINTAILSRTGGNVGIGFAVPARMMLAVVDQLKLYGQVRRGRIGISTAPLTEAQARAQGLTSARGALVSGVDAGSPAQSAGLREGDIIVGAQNRPVSSRGILAAIIGIAAPGTTLDLTYRREGRDGRARVTVETARAVQVTEASPPVAPPAIIPPASAGSGAAPPASPAPVNPSAAAKGGRGQTVLGARFRDVQATDRLASGTVGAYIDAVAAGSAAERRGLRVGDVVIAVNRAQVISAAEMARQLGAASSQAVQIVVLRNNSFVPLTLAE